MSFKDITLKDISRETTFSRTSIYNYFQTKEEIMDRAGVNYIQLGL